MSTDTQANGLEASLSHLVGFGSAFEPPPDPVLVTATDRPSDSNLPAPADPTCDHGDEELASRRRDVERKHRMLAALLDELNLEGIVLGRADSIAWFTCGADLGQTYVAEQGSVLVYVTRQTRAVLADNVQSARAFEEELAGLGFQLKERCWYQDPARVIAELTHNRPAASDLPWPDLRFEADRIMALRRGLTRRERQVLRGLGRSLIQAVEATCCNFQPGETESDVAGHLAHRLIREGIAPIDLRVVGDERLARFRQATFKAVEIRRCATITAVGRRQGLCASATRTVSFGPVDPAFREQHTVAAMVDATCIFFSRPGQPVAEVFRRARRIYEKLGHPHEWELDYQGQWIGYGPREGLLLPESPAVLGNNIALNWSPSVGPARSADTVVIDQRGYEVVTEAQRWPKFDVAVKGFTIARPGILER